MVDEDDRERLVRLEERVMSQQNQISDLKSDVKNLVSRLNRFIQSAVWALASFLLGIIMWLVRKL